jgi:flagellar assembly protein FliH
MAVEQADTRQQQDDRYGKVELFVYPNSSRPYIETDLDAIAREEVLPEDDGDLEGDSGSVPRSVEVGELEACFTERLAEETRRALEAGREQGRQAEREAQSVAQRQADEVRRRQSAELILRFQQERDRYLQAIEPEVVRLALAVAARILRREAQMDPLLLTGAVRVALGQLAGSTAVKLLVPPDDLTLWQDAIALLPHLQTRPTVQAVEDMRLGDCRIETEMGTVDLGIRAQLAEIERGFFDRASGMRASTESGKPAGKARQEGQ